MSDTTPNTALEVEAVINWYKGLSEEIKNFWTFRWTRVEDPEYKDLYETMKAAEKLYRSVKSAQKKAEKAENRKKHEQQHDAS